jgi:hypothetical protein
MNQWISRSNTMSNHYQSNGTQTMQLTRLAKSRSRCKMSPFNH